MSTKYSVPSIQELLVSLGYLTADALDSLSRRLGTMPLEKAVVACGLLSEDDVERVVALRQKLTKTPDRSAELMLRHRTAKYRALLSQVDKQTFCLDRMMA